MTAPSALHETIHLAVDGICSIPACASRRRTFTTQRQRQGKSRNRKVLGQNVTAVFREGHTFGHCETIRLKPDRNYLHLFCAETDARL